MFDYKLYFSLYNILTGFCFPTDVLSSLSSMSSLTPEQSANATPDASLQPSSINSAQRYLFTSSLRSFQNRFITWHRDTKQRRTKEESGAYDCFCGAYKYSTERTSRLQQANANHSNYTYIPRRWVNISLIFIYLYCTYVLHFTREFTKKTILNIRKTRDI